MRIFRRGKQGIDDGNGAHRAHSPPLVTRRGVYAGIYSSMLSSWRKQIAAADRVALAPKKRMRGDGPMYETLQITVDEVT